MILQKIKDILLVALVILIPVWVGLGWYVKSVSVTKAASDQKINQFKALVELEEKKPQRDKEYAKREKAINKNVSSCDISSDIWLQLSD